MKILTNNIATSVLGGMALMSAGVIAAVSLTLLSGNEESSKWILWVVLFPLLVSAELWDGAGDPYRSVVGLLALGFTVAFWSTAVHFLRLLRRSQV